MRRNNKGSYVQSFNTANFNAAKKHFTSKWLTKKIVLYSIGAVIAVSAIAFTSKADIIHMPTHTRAVSLTATTPIQHIVIIEKKSRSFDHYFGTFPGANGATTYIDANG